MAADFMDDDGLVKTRIQLAGSLPQTDASTTPIVQQINFNGASWDRVRNNTQGTLLASAARTASTVSPIQTNYNAKGLMVIVNVTAIGTGSITPYITGTTSSGLPIQLTAGSAITAIGKYVFEVYPGIPPSGVVSGTHITKIESGMIPRRWAANISHSDGSTWTYSVDYESLL